MNNYETTLILFTVLSQLSIGLVAISTIRQIAGPDIEPNKIRTEWMVAGGALLVGMIAAIIHLGHPGGVIRAMNNLGTAWLSREALSTGIFLVLLIAGVLLMREKTNRGLVIVTPLVGLLVIYIMGMTYSPPSFPAMKNVLPFVFFVVTAMLLGASVGTLFCSDSTRPLVNRILTVSLIFGLLIYLIVPCIWLSGGEIMRQTGEQWLASPLYWGRIVIGLALPLAIIWTQKKTPNWLWVIILVGELLGRAVFFANTVHTATNMGGIY